MDINKTIILLIIVLLLLIIGHYTKNKLISILSLLPITLLLLNFLSFIYHKLIIY